MSNSAAKVAGPSLAGWSAAVIAFHVIADLLLVSRPWFLGGDRILLAIALPLSQCSLAILWAVYGTSHVAVRFAVPLLSLFACWHVLATVLPWGIGEPASAACTTLLGVQALTLLSICYLDHRFSLLASLSLRRTGALPRDQSRWTFQLSTLMLWTTVFALALGFVQYGRTHWGWTAQSSVGEFAKAMSLVGLFNALLAALWLWTLASTGKRRVVRILPAGLLITALAYGLSWLISWISGFLELSFRDTLVLAAAQSLFIAGSMAIVLVGSARNRPPTTLDTGETFA